MLFTGVTAWSAAEAAPSAPASGDLYQVYTGVVDSAGMQAIVELGVDRHELQVTPGDDGTAVVEVILSPRQADQLARAGVMLDAKLSAEARVAANAVGVFRRYSGDGGLKQEMVDQAASHGNIAKLVVIGKSVNGQDIVAVKVTKNARTTRDGKRPATVYMGAQHAREWITPEMVRRLLDHVLDNYGSDPTITQLVNNNELWFIPVANPDGYDYTFDVDRMWRKNLRDNNGDGMIEAGVDGVDLNRNLAVHWGYDNEGSSPDPGSDTYRGPSPISEPEMKALDRLFRQIRPKFFINYHSAAQLLLYGTGWQVATPGPDDVIYEAMAGDDATPAVPGYDPDISAELYTTNGDVDTHMQETFGTLGFTPEMSTCATASNVDPDDAWEPDACASDFHFPDDETLIQAEFAKNVPFALAVAASAADPDDPVSVVGRDTPDFVVDDFELSYGSDQTVAVVAKRALRGLQMHYRINGGRVHTKHIKEWEGGERYGDENHVYYAEYRGEVRGARRNDTVEVWFSGRDPHAHFGGRTRSEHFTYTVVTRNPSRVLIIANEDYTGVNPDYPASVTAPKYLDQRVAALQANGVDPDVWDVDAQGVPHDLGVLSHYDVVLWYLGDNRLTQDPEDEVTETFAGNFPDLSVAERQQYLMLAVRDFLNEGGKLAFDGETAGYYGVLASLIGGIFYGLNGAPESDCVVTDDIFSDCLLFADDFTQYYLGAYSRTTLEADGIIGTVGPTTGATALFGGPATLDNPIDEAGAFTPTSDVLPADQFPQFASEAVADYVGARGAFIPVEGSTAAGALHADASYMRLARTFDLGGVGAGDAPTFAAQFSYDVEPGYDHVIVEAHTVGQDDWTTLADLEGGTSSDMPAECEAGFLLAMHPNLTRYIAGGNPCTEVSPGSWNSFTGSSGGWVPVSFDLSAFAGGQVEVVVSMVTDPFTGGTGVMVDATRLVVAGTDTNAEGFEAGLGAWSVLDAPDGSAPNSGNFELTAGLGGIHAAVTTADTVMFGFGLEQIESDADRAAVIGAVLDYLSG